MAYGHGADLARLGLCARPLCYAPANGMILEDGTRVCPPHALEALQAEHAGAPA